MHFRVDLCLDSFAVWPRHFMSTRMHGRIIDIQHCVLWNGELLICSLLNRMYALHWNMRRAYPSSFHTQTHKKKKSSFSENSNVLSRPLSRGLPGISHIHWRYKRTFWNLLNFAAAHTVITFSPARHNRMPCAPVNKFSCFYFERHFSLHLRVVLPMREEGWDIKKAWHKLMIKTSPMNYSWGFYCLHYPSAESLHTCFLLKRNATCLLQSIFLHIYP